MVILPITTLSFFPEFLSPSPQPLASSCFYNKSIATKTTKEVLQKNAERITHWLYQEPHKKDLILNLMHRNPIGYAVLPKSFKLRTNLTQSTTYLKKMPTSEFGFKIVTIYPLVE